MPVDLHRYDRARRISPPMADAVPLATTNRRSVPLAPLGVYAEAHLESQGPQSVVLDAPNISEEQKWRAIFDALVDGQTPALSKEELRTLQAYALDTLHRVFDNKFGDDVALVAQVVLKRAAYDDYRPDETSSRKILADRPLHAKQCDALAFVLRTFRGRNDDDSLLRRVVLDKLGAIGRRRDIAAILPHVRKGDSSDLFHGLQAIRAITGRTGSPQERGGVERHPEVGPLLEKDELTSDEHQLVVEMVLKHGHIEDVHRLDDGSNFNPVYFVTFHETEPDGAGGRRPIRGVFKPETTWEGKDRAYFSREVSAYEFDRSFAQTGLIPPTVEGLLSVDGQKGADIGSLQYMIPNSKPLGYRAFENGHEVWHYDTDFAHLESEPEFQAQMSRARTLLYVLGDPDKLPSNVKPLPNLANFMVSDGRRLWLIDNAYSQGAAPKPDRHMLPAEHDGSVLGSFTSTLDQQGADDITYRLSWYIEDHDASEVSRRTTVAKSELEKRPKRSP